MRTRTTAIAALFVVLPALSVLGPSVANAQPPAAAAGPSKEDVEAAKNHFGKGSDLFKANKFAEALEEFKASYGKVASPNSHLYVARCMREMGQLVDAYLEFEKVTAEAQTAGEKYAQTGETAKAEHDELNAKIALISVNVTTPEIGAKLSIGGKEVPQDRWGKPYPAMPGSVEVRLEAPGKTAATQTVAASAGETKDVSVSFTGGATDGGDQSGGGDGGGGTSGGSKTSGMRIGAFVAGGVGVAGLVTFAVAGSMSNSTYSHLEEVCGSSPCPSQYASDVSKGKSQQTIANVGLIVGAVGVAAGATLFVLSLKGKKADEPQTSLMIGPGSLGVRGTF